jgi:hypothetical protein
MFDYIITYKYNKQFVEVHIADGDDTLAFVFKDKKRAFKFLKKIRKAFKLFEEEL